MAHHYDGRVILVILLMTTIVFFIGFVVMLFVYFTKTAQLIQPGNCLSTTNTYLATPATTGPILTCTTGPCVFQATTLQAAVSLCQSQPTICKQFVWAAQTGTVAFVGTPFTATTNTDVNLYTAPVT